MSDHINDPKTAGTAGVMTRRSLFLSLPGWPSPAVCSRRARPLRSACAACTR